MSKVSEIVEVAKKIHSFIKKEVQNILNHTHKLSP